MIKFARFSPLAVLALAILSASVVARKTVSPKYKTVIELMTKQKDFKTMVLAATTASLLSTFSDSKLVATVFLPTDQAFEAYFNETGASPVTVLKNIARLSSIIKYHVHQGKAYSSFKLLGKTTLKMMNNQSVEVSRNLLNWKNIYLKDASGRTVTADIRPAQAGLASVYVLHNILLPK